MQLGDVVAHLQAIAPLALAESWDNVGLLVGDASRRIDDVMCCIDATPPVLAEATAAGAQLVVAYHPCWLRPLHRVPPTHPLVWAVQHDLAIYSPHTAWDAVDNGTNAVLARAAGLRHASPLVRSQASQVLSGASASVLHDAGTTGQGRVGDLPQRAACSLEALAGRLQAAMCVPHVLVARAGAAGARLRRIAVAAGAGDALWPAARAAGAAVFVTGELRHHTALAALASGVSVVALGHDGSERASLAALMQALRARAPELHVWQSNADVTPWRVVGVERAAPHGR